MSFADNKRVPFSQNVNFNMILIITILKMFCIPTPPPPPVIVKHS